MLQYGPINFQKPVTNHHLSKGLVRWWLSTPQTFGKSKWIDLCGVNHATLTNMAVSSTSRWAGNKHPGGYGSLRFDGVNDYCQGVSSNVLANTGLPFTVSAWAWLYDTSNAYPNVLMLASNTTSGWQLAIGSNDVDYRGILIGGPDAGWGRFKDGTTRATFTAGWNHVTATYNGSGATTVGNWAVYLNGKATTLATAGSFATIPNVNAVGGYSTARTNLDWFPGFIDDVKVYNRALSASLVYELYKNSLAGYPGLLNRQAKIISSVSAPVITGTGTFAVEAPALSGSGEVAYTGTGTFAVEAPALASTGTVEVTGTGNITAEVPAFASTGTVAVTGTGSITIEAPALSGTVTPVSYLYIDTDFVFHDYIHITGDVTFADGNIDISDSTWTIGGNLSASAPVNFVTNSFAGSDWTVEGDFDFNGTSNNRLNLEATDTWFLNVSGEGSATHVVVANSDASDGSEIDASVTGVDEGDNLNWLFPVVVSIEEAIISYLEDELDCKVYGSKATRSATYPVIIFNRISAGLMEHNTAALEVAEPVFHFHIWGRTAKETKELTRELWQLLHFQHSEWAALPILSSKVENHYDIPPYRGKEKEHKNLCHSVLETRIQYRCPFPEFTTPFAANDESIETALIDYVEHLSGETVHYMEFNFETTYPAVMIERFGGGYESHLTGSLGLQEGSYRLHIYGSTFNEVCQMGDTLWQGLHSFNGYWGEIRVKCRIDDISDMPLDEGTDPEHLNLFHRIVDIVILHTEAVIIL